MWEHGYLEWEMGEVNDMTEGLMGVLGIKGSVRASGKPEKLVSSIPRCNQNMSSWGPSE